MADIMVNVFRNCIWNSSHQHYFKGVWTPEAQVLYVTVTMSYRKDGFNGFEEFNGFHKTMLYGENNIKWPMADTMANVFRNCIWNSSHQQMVNDIVFLCHKLMQFGIPIWSNVIFSAVYNVYMLYLSERGGSGLQNDIVHRGRSPFVRAVTNLFNVVHVVRR
jgi:hypothetical protein